jgi:hypothetical protein
MKHLQIDEIQDNEHYELSRESFRADIVRLKMLRRVSVGDLITLVFENRSTIQFQIQEIMRAEKIVSHQRVQEELDTYNVLLPGTNQLTATLFIEVTDQPRMRETLDRLIGIDRGDALFLEIGGERMAGEFEGGHSNEVRVSAVHFVTFNLTPKQANAITTATAPVSLVVDHPDYQASVSLSADVLASLADDLNAE